MDQQFREIALRDPFGDDFWLYGLPKIMRLALEPIIENHSVLIFCSTRRECELTAERLAKCIITAPNFPRPSSEIEIKRNQLLLVLRVIAVTGTGASRAKVWNQLIPMGIGIHHSGLSIQERELVEEAYRYVFLSISNQSVQARISQNSRSNFHSCCWSQSPSSKGRFYQAVSRNDFHDKYGLQANVR